MRHLVLAAAATVLAACGSQPAEEPVTEQAPEPTAAAAMPTVANGSGPGTYVVTMADGTTMTAVINADGTYSDTAADGKLVAEGSWTVTDGKTCFSPATEGVEAMCYTETPPAADGSFTATPDRGEPVTVRPLDVQSMSAELY